jgi:exonuclease SbcC
MMLDDCADRLRKRLAVSRQHQQEGHALIRDRTKAQEKKRQAVAVQVTEAAVLAGPLHTSRVCDDRAVCRNWKNRRRKNVSCGNHSRSCASNWLMLRLSRKQSLRARLTGLDVPALESERERCRTERVRLEQEQTSAQRTEEQARRALEVIDASDRAALAREAMESAAARYRSAIRPWARLKLARGAAAGGVEPIFVNGPRHPWCLPHLPTFR